MTVGVSRNIRVVAPNLTKQEREELERYLDELLVWDVVQYELGFKNEKDAPKAIQKVLNYRRSVRKKHG